MQQRLLLLSLLLYPLALGLNTSLALGTVTNNLDQQEGWVSSTSASEATIKIREGDLSYTSILLGLAVSPTSGPPEINGSAPCQLLESGSAMQPGNYTRGSRCNSYSTMGSTSVSSHSLPSLTFDHGPTPSPSGPSLVPYTGTGPRVYQPSSVIAMIVLMGIRMWLV